MGSYDDLPVLGDAPARTEELVRTRAHLPIRRFSLAVTAGPDRARTYVSHGVTTTVGTHALADLRLTDPAMSRFHCELTIEPDGRVRLRDLGSKNGTRVNGVWIDTAWLERKASLRLGQNVVEFELSDETHALPVSEQGSFGDLVGASPAMRNAFALLEAAASSDITVLLHGETGTGKELAAEAIHLASARRAAPFVIVDCGALPAHLLQAEMFGHVRGAFTGANSDRKGVFEAADHGTVFLDEIGELPLELQPNLLRVIEARDVARVGDHHRIPVDVKIIAATHRDLRKAVNQKLFRADLYYRLAVLPITLPPLRDRLSDLPLIVERLCDRLAVTPETRARLVSPEVVADLAKHDWPGNVRELRNYLERASVAGDRDVLDRAQATTPAASIDINLALPELKQRWTEHLERAYLQELSAAVDGNVAEMAERSRMSRMQIYRLLRKYGLKGE